MNWKKYYADCSDYFVKNISKSPPIVTGFNANIDAVRYVDNELLEKLGRNYSSRKHVETMEDLGRGINESIELSEANEWELENNELYPEILDIGYDEIRMGGQAGIVMNIMARMGLEVRIMLPVIPQKQVKLFANRNIRTPLMEGNHFSIRNVRKSGDELVEPRTNAIFEFKKGFMGAQKSNRFILSYRPKNHKPLINERIVLHSKDIFSGVKRAFFSGYQLLEHNTEFTRAADQIKYMREFAPDTKFHLELTNVEENKIRKNIVKIASNYNSVGCNDVELELYSGTDQIFEGMRRIVNKTGIERLHVHTMNNHYCLIHRDYGLSAVEEQKRMMMGALAASAKAFHGEIKHKKEVKEVKGVVSREGVNYLKKIDNDNGIIEMKNYDMIIIPNFQASKVKSTVGLGDSISSAAFISETV